jgi:UDP-N-acetyl-D-mannosaminuronic acid dehydrogenase
MYTTRSISVLGLGYVGLPTAAVLAQAGFDILGVDVKEEIVQIVNRGEIHIHEEGLGELVHTGVQKGKLRASLKLEPSDAYIIAVPTPIRTDRTPNLSFIDSATRMIAGVMKHGDLILVESTIPPRTCLDFIAPLIESLTGWRHEKDYDLAHCPERVTPGRTLHELVFNDRIVGGTTPRATARGAEIYRSFVKGKILETNSTTAEMTKLMENTYRDVNIALANEFANFSETLGIDVFEAIQLANHHHTVHIHSPGIGVGGHCIPVVPWFIVSAAPEKAHMITLARQLNDQRPQAIFERMMSLKARGAEMKLAFFGLSFKPNVDDLSESPAIEIVRMAAGALNEEIYVVEPHIRSLPGVLAALANVRLVSAEEAKEKAQILIQLVAHRAFEGEKLIDITRPVI